MKAIRALMAVVLVSGLVGATVAAPTGAAHAVVTHPFLIVTAGDYAGMNARAATAPWSSWKSNALSDAIGITISAGDDYVTQSRKVANIAGAASLAYILDAANKLTYRDRVIYAIDYFDTNLRPGLTASDWNRAVPPATAFFDLVIALDVIYPDMTAAQITNAETKLAAAAAWFNSASLAWKLAQFGARGIWALYTDNATNITAAKNGYRTEMFAMMSSSGVANTGPWYAGWRLGSESGERDVKTYFLDVLEFTGHDTNYYNNAQIQDMYEWLYGYSVTPVDVGLGRESYTFGDSAMLYDPLTNSGSIYRGYRFGTDAASNAAWAVAGVALAPGRLIPYALAQTALPAAPPPPRSRIFSNGGAWFLDGDPGNDALAGALWNNTTSGAHSHKDVNAVHLTAFNEHMLRNSGYLGFGLGSSGYAWSYVHDRAISSNTVLIDYGTTFVDTAPPTTNDHSATKQGAGIVEGLTSTEFDYASGGSGTALPNGKHVRNFVFVHPQDGKGGYWVLFDEVDATASNVNAHVALHPNSGVYTTVTADTEYQFDTGAAEFSVFLATPPTQVQVRNGLLANSNQSFVGKYLYSTYGTDASGQKNVVTVLFPSDPTHPKAAMTRISGSGYTGAAIDLGGGVVDYAVESAGTSIIAPGGGVALQGLAGMYRKTGTATDYFFVRQGTSFSDGAGHGFTAPTSVSVHLKDKLGSVTAAAATTVTLQYPGITSVKVDGVTVAPASSGPGTMSVVIPAGRHTIELVTGGVPPVTAVKDWGFNTAGYREGWTMVSHLSSTVSGGSLNLTTTGIDPYMKSPDNLGITTPATYDTITVRMSNSTALTSARLYFITTADTVYNGAKSIAITLIPSSGPTDYVLDMSTIPTWVGTIRQLRLDPLDPATGTGQTVGIDFVRVTN